MSDGHHEAGTETIVDDVDSGVARTRFSSQYQEEVTSILSRSGSQYSKCSLDIFLFLYPLSFR